MARQISDAAFPPLVLGRSTAVPCSFINNTSRTARETTTMPHQGHQGAHHGNGHGHDSHDDGHHGLHGLHSHQGHGHHGHDDVEDCEEEANETSALLCADVDFSKVSAQRSSRRAGSEELLASHGNTSGAAACMKQSCGEPTTEGCD